MYLSESTITGRRQENQDSIYIKQANNAFVMAVADGMGGHLGGKIASKTVVSIVKKLFKEFSHAPSYKKIKPFIEKIIAESQKEIQTISRSDQKLKGLGTTLTIVLGYYSRYAIGNIGDSRTYLINKEDVTLMTQDHTFLTQYKKQNPGKTINRAMAEKFGKLLTKCIDGKGDTGDITPEKDLYRLRPAEVLLACSDGMIVENGLMPRDYIKRIIEQSKNIEKAKDFLIKYAYNKGSRDNISVAIASKSYKPRYKSLMEQYSPVISFVLSTVVSLIIFIYFLVHLLVNILPDKNDDNKSEDFTAHGHNKTQHELII
ncbi:MAG: PP2C family protein-serine/threonine phosphatase [Fidelibacterota bacterium]